MKILMFSGGSLNRGCETIVKGSGVALLSKAKSTIVDLASQKPDSDVLFH
jgi:hypothetical protein